MVIRETETGAMMRCKVRGCAAYMQLTRKGVGFTLYKLDPEHEHRMKFNKKGRLPKIKNSEVE
jgi:hypothetical protein